MPRVGKPISCPMEREDAQERYREKFGEDFPLYYTYNVYGNDWQSEVKFIDKCIAENKPAPFKELVGKH